MDEVEIMVDQFQILEPQQHVRHWVLWVERLGETIPRFDSSSTDTLSDRSKSGDRLSSAPALAEVISGRPKPSWMRCYQPFELV
ncbi:BEM_HP_G0080780.mRNA.1.CDS.1 [Saccharomyces cerevisiae]|nr:BEM_HP_G0080780.mRNA.1.CDS.1 [Saccharomyces cerevisiae]CAI6992473.1 BEM_HP_G0080780.mRNA.1.CDS.1 [Saccharomyces cerevisiae]